MEDFRNLFDSGTNEDSSVNLTLESSDVIIFSSILLLQVVVLLAFKQPFISKTGKIKLWNGNIYGSENSQHLTDWYTPTHVIHGFILYALTALFLPKWSIKSRFLIALGIEVGWELAENSPIIINRYRQTGLAQGYSGDSVVNSVVDTLAMSTGFFIAAHLSPLAVLLIAIAEEIILGYAIHDNFTLNVVQLVHPFEAISTWQAEISKKDKQKINVIDE